MTFLLPLLMNNAGPNVFYNKSFINGYEPDCKTLIKTGARALGH